MPAPIMAPMPSTAAPRTVIVFGGPAPAVGAGAEVSGGSSDMDGHPLARRRRGRVVLKNR